jgi:streptogramin lyase
MRRGACAGLAVVLLLGACTADPSGTSPSVSPTPVPTTSADPGEPADVEELATATIAIETPDWMAAGFGAVWVHQDTAEVARIDPATDEVETIRLDEGLCQGIAAGLGAVWTCEVDHLVRIDPASGAVARVDLARTPGSGRFPVTEGRVWVLTGLKGDLVTGIDRRGRAVATVALPGRCDELSSVADAGRFWVACAASGTVLEVDADAGEVVATFEGMLGAIQVLPTADSLWVVADDGLLRVDRASGQVIATILPSPGATGSLTAVDGIVWTHAAVPYLQAIDPATNEVVAEIASRIPSGGDLLAAGGALWVSQFDGNLVRKIPLDALPV